jgi:ArsR family transcriptional regulator, nickel/cobalt-responsive transcriptional repressor
MRDTLQSERCARFLKALADPERLRIIQCLRQGPMNVSALTKALGGEIANVSHHLGVLRHAGLVVDRKQGKFVEYSLAPDVVPDGAPGDVVDLGCCRLQLGKK